MKGAVRSLLVTALVVTAALPAAADWLVTREGAKVETRGKWEVKGRVVVFTRPDGSLASLRLTETDLEASRKLTARGGQVEETTIASRPEEATPRKRRVVTDKDVGHSESAAGPAEPAKAKSDPPAPAPAPVIAVANWQREADSGDRHVVITGRVLNSGKAVATDITLSVHVFDESGKRLATVPGTLTAVVLKPGQEGTFRADFPGLFSFAEVKFEAKSSSNLATEPETKGDKGVS
jgi:hypothetical protein